MLWFIRPRVSSRCPAHILIGEASAGESMAEHAGSFGEVCYGNRDRIMPLLGEVEAVIPSDKIDRRAIICIGLFSEGVAMYAGATCQTLKRPPSRLP
jgi:hypothetical protein